MQPNAFNDITTGKKVVFIIVTAGDAGLGRKFWEAREAGCLSSIRYCLAPFGDCIEKKGKKRVLDYFIDYASISNVLTYFLRIPDGNVDGSGFEVNGYQSLYNLLQNKTDVLFKIDNSGNFNGSAKIAKLIEAIVFQEATNMSARINYLNPDLTVNCDDHNDHICVGKIIQQIQGISNYKQALFQGYRVSKFAERLTAEEMFWKIGMFAAYEKKIQDLTGYSTIRENPSKYTEWCLCKSNYVWV